jgi:nitrite reductase (NO-forming)
MSRDDVPLLSSVLDGATGRRSFLSRAALLGTTLPALGTALAACDEKRAAAPARLPAEREAPPHQHSNDDAAPVGSGAVGYRRYDPRLPPAASQRRVHIEMTVREMPVRLNRDVVVPAWTFDGTVPGPIVHVRQGDTVDFTLHNGGSLPHSMDFHAAQINPKVAFRSALPKQSLSYTFTPRYAGAYLYHCGTQPVLMHIGSGMYGAIIVDPPTPLRPAQEFVLVQSEFYVSKDGKGGWQFDYQRMLGTLPDYVSFNGVANQYMDEPIRVKQGDRVRFYLVNAGPSHPCSFHIVGEQFDTVYLGAPPDNAIHGVQTFGVAPGGGMIFELDCDVKGEFPFVNHGFGHGQKGAIGFLVVE